MSLMLEYVRELMETPAVPWLLTCGFMALAITVVLHKITK